MGGVLITGASGRLGLHLAWQARACDLELCLVSRSRALKLDGARTAAMDLRDRAAVRALFAEVRPACVIHAAAWTDVDGCESDPGAARSQIVEATASVADAASALSSCMIFISTDFVFDGRMPPYDEGHAVSPINEYGRAKAAAEVLVRARVPQSLVVRGTFVGEGPPGRPGLVEQIVARQPLGLDPARRLTPLTTLAFARAVLALVRGLPAAPVLHLTSRESVTAPELAGRIARALAENLVIVPPRAKPGPRAPRPCDTSLATLAEASGVPSLDEQLDELARHCRDGLSRRFAEMSS